jgi:RNA polymerase-binding transcription factor DksA
VPDHMDAIQERCLREQEEAVARIERQLDGGLGECEDCGAGVSETRRKLGARKVLPLPGRR